MDWWQYVGAFLTGSGGAAAVNLLSQQRGIRSLDHRVLEHDQTVDRQRLFHEATDLIDGMRLEIDRLRRDVSIIRAECESRQGHLQQQLETMHQEVSYWRQIAGELRRDNAQLKSEVGRLQARLSEVEHQQGHSNNETIDS